MPRSSPARVSTPSPGLPRVARSTGEALFNDGCKGPESRIQLPAARITRLLGIMLDLDPGKLDPRQPVFPPGGRPPRVPREHPARPRSPPPARDAEVRISGTGLHADPLARPARRAEVRRRAAYWAAIVAAVQASCRRTRNAPGITALTRPVGSINSKNGGRVEILEPGSPIDPQRRRRFRQRVAGRAVPDRREDPARRGAISPCPICRSERSRLDVLDHAGKCYGCGTVALRTLFDAIFSREAGPRTRRGRRSERPGDRAGGR